ncbi:DUF1173 domain-containing protein [Acinetobacter baumannii]|uniref:DUF1173 domain-containing protein n=1 Tax=Acinetobacter TaxID=469 RepID=UPI0002CFE67C|nr:MULTISPECIES: DUF1173 domain-containing protein [Acinetobacter]EKW1488014.1 DUF1173 domain-containing protein [Acinetobacter baumannii]ENV65148.1 hypothetical protein F949_00047 [Acinetobacter junii NIPH 182]MBV6768702.1 DUF1173 domain-containing protein [Acinetobacter baumannii]
MLIRIGGMEVDPHAENIQDILRQAYAERQRPLCLCVNGGVPLYIAKVNNSFIVKRMPNTGGSHNPGCVSYEPPHELSGLGEVLGQAIQENPEDGSVALKFDFALTKRGGKAPPPATGKEHDSVATDGKKLTLRGLLHYLFEEGKLNYYQPKEKANNWYFVRKQLLRAASDKSAKKQDLASTLYIPETYNMDIKKDIAARRHEQLSNLSAQNLMIVIGEVKSIEKARYDFKLIAKHCPDYHFFMNEDVHNRINKRFEKELGLWNMYGDQCHLMFICTILKTASDLPLVQEISFMLVNKQWVPFESKYEYELIEDMIDNSRQFIKGLRYNLPSDKPLASLVAVDTEPKPTAMYIIPSSESESESYAQGIEQMIAESDYASWQWFVDKAMPGLPSKNVE